MAIRFTTPGDTNSYVFTGADTPITDSDFANKHYVDTEVAHAIDNHIPWVDTNGDYHKIAFIDSEEHGADIYVVDSDYTDSFDRVIHTAGSNVQIITFTDPGSDTEFPIPLNTPFIIELFDLGRIIVGNTSAPGYAVIAGGQYTWQFDSDQISHASPGIQDGFAYDKPVDLRSVETFTKVATLADTDWVKANTVDDIVFSAVGAGISVNRTGNNVTLSVNTNTSGGSGLKFDDLSHPSLIVDTDIIADTDWVHDTLRGYVTDHAINAAGNGVRIEGVKEAGNSSVSLTNIDNTLVFDVPNPGNAGIATVRVDTDHIADTEWVKAEIANSNNLGEAYIDINTVHSQTAPDASGTDAMAFGANAEARGTYSIALGSAADGGASFRAAQALSDNAVAIGRFAHVDSDHTSGVAIGAGAVTTVANEMRLGGSGALVTIHPDRTIADDNQLATKAYVDTAVHGPQSLVLNSTSPDAIAVKDSESVTAGFAMPTSDFDQNDFRWNLPVTSTDSQHGFGMQGITITGLSEEEQTYFRIDTDTDLGSGTPSGRKAEYLTYIGTDGGRLDTGWLTSANITGSNQLGFRLTNSFNNLANVESYMHVQVVHWSESQWNRFPHLSSSHGRILYQSSHGNTGFSNSTGFHSGQAYATLNSTLNEGLILNNGDRIGIRGQLHIINCDTEGIYLTMANGETQQATMFSRIVYGQLYIDSDSNLYVTHADTDTIHDFYNFADDRILPDRLSGPNNENTPGSSNFLRGDGRWEPVGGGSQQQYVKIESNNDQDSDADIGSHHQAIAIGPATQVLGSDSIAIGHTAIANGATGVVLGTNARADSTNNIVIGSHSSNSTGHTRADEDKSIAIGNDAAALAERSIVIGTNSEISGSGGGNDGIIIGHNINISGNNDSSIVMGNGGSSEYTLSQNKTFALPQIERIHIPFMDADDNSINQEAHVVVDDNGNWTVEDPKWWSAVTGGWDTDDYADANGPDTIAIGMGSSTSDTETNTVRIGGHGTTVASHPGYLPSHLDDFVTKRYVDQAIQHPVNNVVNKENANEIGFYRDTDFTVAYDFRQWDSSNTFVFETGVTTGTRYYPFRSSVNPATDTDLVWEYVEGSLSAGVLNTVWPTDGGNWRVLRYIGADGGTWKGDHIGDTTGTFTIQNTASDSLRHSGNRYQVELVRISAKDWTNDPLTSAGTVLASSELKGMVYSDSIGSETRTFTWSTNNQDTDFLLNTNDIIMMRLKVVYNGGFEGTVRLYGNTGWSTNARWAGEAPVVTHGFFIDSDGNLGIFQENPVINRMFYSFDSDFIMPDRLATNAADDSFFLRGDGTWASLDTGDALRIKDTDGTFSDVHEVEHTDYGMQVDYGNAEYVNEFAEVARVASTNNLQMFVDADNSTFPIALGNAFTIEVAGNEHATVSNNVAPTYHSVGGVHYFEFLAAHVSYSSGFRTTTPYRGSHELLSVHSTGTKFIHLADTDWVKGHVSDEGGYRGKIDTDKGLDTDGNTLKIKVQTGNLGFDAGGNLGIDTGFVATRQFVLDRLAVVQDGDTDTELQTLTYTDNNHVEVNHNLNLGFSFVDTDLSPVNAFGWISVSGTRYFFLRKPSNDGVNELSGRIIRLHTSTLVMEFDDEALVSGLTIQGNHHQLYAANSMTFITGSDPGGNQTYLLSDSENFAQGTEANPLFLLTTNSLDSDLSERNIADTDFVKSHSAQANQFVSIRGTDAASANGSNSIAIGDGASTGNAANDSIAIGHGASTSVARRLVIGDDGSSTSITSIETPGFTGGSHQYIAVDANGVWTTETVTNSGNISAGNGINVSGSTISVDTDVIADTDWVKEYVDEDFVAQKTYTTFGAGSFTVLASDNDLGGAAANRVVFENGVNDNEHHMFFSDANGPDIRNGGYYRITNFTTNNVAYYYQTHSTSDGILKRADLQYFGEISDSDVVDGFDGNAGTVLIANAPAHAGDSNFHFGDGLHVDGTEISVDSDIRAIAGKYAESLDAATPAFPHNAATASGNDALALGTTAVATGEETVAIGHHAMADTDQATAVGWDAEATGAGATAIGRQSIAAGIGAVAVGQNSNAPHDFSGSLGNKTPSQTGEWKIGHTGEDENGDPLTLRIHAGTTLMVDTDDSLIDYFFLRDGKWLATGQDIIAVETDSELELHYNVNNMENAIGLTGTTDRDLASTHHLRFFTGDSEIANPDTAALGMEIQNDNDIDVFTQSGTRTNLWESSAGHIPGSILEFPLSSGSKTDSTGVTIHSPGVTGTAPAVYWQRVGNMVTVSGQFNFGATSAQYSHGDRIVIGGLIDASIQPDSTNNLHVGSWTLPVYDGAGNDFYVSGTVAISAGGSLIFNVDMIGQNNDATDLNQRSFFAQNESISFTLNWQVGGTY